MLVSFQGYKMAQGWWISAMFLEDVFVFFSSSDLSSMEGLWLDPRIIQKRPATLFGFHWISRDQFYNKPQLWMLWSVIFAFSSRVYNNTSNTSNIFLGRCYTHGCVAITISIGLIGNPFRESAVFVFPRWSSRGLKSTSSLHACLQWPRHPNGNGNGWKNGGNVGSGSNDPLKPRIHKLASL